MKKIIKYLKNLYRKPDMVKCDLILQKLDMPRWNGLVGDIINYPDTFTNIPIITIKLSKNNVNFILDPNKEIFTHNIGLIDLNKKERIYIYQKIEKFMTDQLYEQTNLARNAILARIGISEADFTFLVSSCRL